MGSWRRYTATLHGPATTKKSRVAFWTISGARVWAEQHGFGADFCEIRDRDGVLVGIHEARQDRLPNCWEPVEPIPAAIPRDWPSLALRAR